MRRGPRRRSVAPAAARGAASPRRAALLCGFRRAGPRLAAAATAPAGGGDGAAVRIYTYDLPGCSMEDFPPEAVDAPEGKYPPLLPIHWQLRAGRYTTRDPSNATMFYIPAPFFIWDNADTVTGGSAAAAACSGALVVHVPRPGPVRTAGPGAAVSWPGAPVGAGNFTVAVWHRYARGGLAVAASAAVGLAGLGRALSDGPGADAGGSRAAFVFGLFGGCPAVAACSGEGAGVPWHAGGPGTCIALADGRWHHLALTVDSRRVARLFADGGLIDSATLPASPVAGAASEPPGASGGWRALCRVAGGAGDAADAGVGGEDGAAYEGEVRDARLYSVELDQLLVNRCAGVHSPESGCFVEVRELMEASPWFQRSLGYDHFVLFAGWDYPGAFEPHHAPVDEHYVLETAWPAFRHLMLLHVGSGTERCAASYLGPNPSREHQSRAHYHDRCHSEGPSWCERQLAKQRPLCAQRLARTVTIPPSMPGEPLLCRETKATLTGTRRHRVAYRGLTSAAMIERSVFADLAKTPLVEDLQRKGWLHFEFTNWTYEKLSAGVCSRDMAFDGLCAWKSVGRHVQGFADGRHHGMQKMAVGLWKHSELCLVLPGDGDYERTLYSIINLGCVPVFVSAPGTSFPKIPFVGDLPWHEFAIFWALDPAGVDDRGIDSTGYMEALRRSGIQMLEQLLSMSAAALRRKQQALLRHMPGLSWSQQRRCAGRGPAVLPSALDLLARELARVARLPRDPAAFDPAMRRHKDALGHVLATKSEDVTGNGGADLLNVPLAPHLEAAQRAAVGRGPPDALDSAPGRARLALISFSTRPAISGLTWPTLRAFVDAHPGRYDLFLFEEPLLDHRDFHPAWNKLAFLRRMLLTGHPGLQYKYDAVIWIDDDIAITNPSHDVLYAAVQEKLMCPECYSKYVVAGRDTHVWTRLQLNSGVLIMKGRSEFCLRLISELFRIGRKKQFLGGVWRLARKEGWWDQDAFATWIQQQGHGQFAFLEHRHLQSLVRGPEGAPAGAPPTHHWRPGDFAAHFTNLARFGGVEEQVAFVRQSLEVMRAAVGGHSGGATFAGGAPAA